MADAAAASIKGAQQQSRIQERLGFTLRHAIDDRGTATHKTINDRGVAAHRTTNILSAKLANLFPSIANTQANADTPLPEETISQMVGSDAAQNRIQALRESRVGKFVDRIGGAKDKAPGTNNDVNLSTDEGRSAALKNVLQQRSIGAIKNTAIETAKAELRRRTRQLVKKQIKAGTRKLVQFVMNTLADILPATVVGTIVSVLVWLLTLGMWNVEMIYGTYMAKGKSYFIDPLSFDPLPIPLKPIWFELLVVVLDLAVGIILIIVTALCLLPFVIPLQIIDSIGINIFGVSLL